MSINPPHTVSFAGQDTLLARLPDIMTIAQRHGLALSPWQACEKTARNFRVKLPFIGAFSAGKTSLINALLGKKQFSVEVTPETAVAAHIRFGPTFSAELVSETGQRVPLGEEALAENTFPHWGPSASLTLTHPAMAAWPHVQIIDLPGWGSGISAHERVIDAHAAESLAYVLVVSADEGTLRENLIRALAELAALKMPLILVINKVDKRPPQDVKDVMDGIVRAVEKHSSTPPVMTVRSSARKGQVDELRQALTLMEKRADERFAAGVLRPAVDQLTAMAAHLERLASRHFADQDVIETEKDVLKAEIADWTAHLARETQKLHAQVAPIQNTLLRRLRDGLFAQQERYFGVVEGGGTLSDAVLMDARSIIGETLRSDFEPAVKRYLGALDHALPGTLSLPALQRLEEIPKGSFGGGVKAGGAGALAALALPLVVTLPIVGQIIAVALPLLGALFSHRHERKQQEMEAARARERLRSQIQSHIEKATQEMSTHLGTQLDTRITEAEATIAAHVEKEKAQRERVLHELEARLQEGEEQAAKAREIAARDLETVRGHERDLAAFLGRG
jgi:GTP-binding protein EngB required for normal cell division